MHPLAAAAAACSLAVAASRSRGAHVSISALILRACECKEGGSEVWLTGMLVNVTEHSQARWAGAAAG